MLCSFACLFTLLSCLHITWSLPAIPDRDITFSLHNRAGIYKNNGTSARADAQPAMPPRFDDLVNVRMTVLRETWEDVETIAVEGRSLYGPSRAPWAYRTIFMKLFDPASNTVFTTSTVPDSGNPPQWTEPDPVAPRPGQQLQPWEWDSDAMTLGQAFRIVDTWLGEQEPWRRIWKGKFRSLRARFPDQVYFLFSTALERPGNVMVGVLDQRVYQRNSPSTVTLPESTDNSNDDVELVMDDVENSDWVLVAHPATSVGTS